MFKTNNLSAAIKRLDAIYDKEWYDWLPETLSTVITNRWGQISNIDLSRLLAARNLINRDWFWHDVDIFAATVHSFNWNDVDYREGLHPSPGQIAYAVYVARGLTNGGKKFDKDVAQYIATIFLAKGYVYIPDELQLGGVQVYIDMFGRNEDLKKAVETKWKSMMGDENYELEETPVDVQLAHLLAVKKFVEMDGTGRPMDKRQALAKLILS